MRINLKTVILTLISAFLVNSVATSAFALPDIESEAEAAKVDELELEHEVETLESYGEAAGSQQEKTEVAQLKRETRSLENKIDSLRRQNTKARQKAIVLARAYRNKEKTAAKVQAKANSAERENNKLQAKNEGLRSRVQA
ncbi:MAG: hypothetical protein AABZ31_04385, partial [Bdellovibrionota bacterium]